MYDIVEHSEYIKSIEKCKPDARIVNVAKRKIKFLAYDPKHGSLNCHSVGEVSLDGKKVKVWVFYVNKQFRVCFLYAKSDQIILINFSKHYEKPLKEQYTLEGPRVT